MIFPAGKGLASICCGFALAALPFNCAQAPPTAAEEEHSVAPV